MFNRHLITPDWVVIAAGIGAALHIGKLPPALPHLIETFDLSLLSSSFLLSIMMLAGLSLGVMIGAGAETLGQRRALLTGLLMLSVSSLAGGFSQTPQQLLITRAIEGLGFLLIVLPAPSLIRQWVAPEYLSRRLGWWTSYMGLGLGISLLLGPPWLEVFSWRSWWLCMAVISMALFTFALWGLPAVTPPQQQSHTWIRRIQITLTHRGPWLVAITFGVYAAQWMAIIGFLPTLYTQAHYASWQLGLFTAAVAMINIAGNIAAGQLIYRGLSAFRVIALGFIMMLVTAWVAFALLGPGPLQILVILLFSGLGGLIPGSLFYVSVQFTPTPDTLSTSVGWIQQWSSIGQFSGPPLLALAVSWAGQWSVSWVVTGILAILGLLMTVLMWRHQHPLSIPNSSSV